MSEQIDVNIRNNSQSMIPPADNPSMLGDGKNNSLLNNAQINNVETTNRLSDGFNNVNDQLKKTIELFKDLNDEQRKALQNLLLPPTPSPSPSPTPNPLPDSSPNPGNNSNNNGLRLIRGVNGVVTGTANNFSNVVSYAANGNALGVVGNGLNSAGNTLNKATEAATMVGATDIAAILGPVMIGAYATAGITKGLSTLSQQYKKALPGIDELLSSFGGNEINQNSADVNANIGINLRNRILEKNKGTGLTAESFLDLTNSLGRYGISDYSRAADIAQLSARYGSFTNTDPNQVANFAGMIERYGGDGTSALNGAYGYAKASGLSRNQFGEFLSGLQKVVEDGISKGYIKSTDQVGENLTMLARLSGNNQMWMGEQGANRYMQMQGSISNMTGLNSTTSLVIARTAQDLIKANGLENLFTREENGKTIKDKNLYLSDSPDSVLNTLAYVEQGGMDAGFMKQFAANLNKTYGGDIDSQVGAIKEAYGLNWNGSIQLYNMMQKLNSGEINESEFTKQAKSLQEDPNTKSDNKRLQEVLSDLDKQMANFGKNMAFKVELESLDNIEGITEKIYDAMVNKDYNKTAETLSNRLFDTSEGKQKDLFLNKIKNDLNSNDETTRNKAIEFLKWLDSQDNATLSYYNNNNNIIEAYNNPRKRESHSDYLPMITNQQMAFEFGNEPKVGKKRSYNGYQGTIESDNEKLAAEIYYEIGHISNDDKRNNALTQLGQVLGKYEIQGQADNAGGKTYQYGDDMKEALYKLINTLELSKDVIEKNLTANKEVNVFTSF